MNIAVFGAQGRVGSKVVEIAQQRGHTVVPIDIKNKSDDNMSNLTNISVSSNTTTTKNKEKTNKITIDAVIDFSTAEATPQVCEYCKLHRCPLVSGVTGRNNEQQKLIDELNEQLPVVCKANFSVGVDMLRRICEIVAKELPDWDCEIVETHRRGKLDAPSGTAKALASTVAKHKSFKSVTTHALRLGSNFGRHEVIFAANGESLTLTHQAESVDIFALGAILEAENLVK